MSDNRTRFKNAVQREINSWGEDIEIKANKNIGLRFLNKPRTLDLILKHRNKYLAIKTTYQKKSGTAYQKLPYTLQDLSTCPIPTLIVFAGSEIIDDIKSFLITSGNGIEVKFHKNEDNENLDYILDTNNMLKQRIFIELGLDWFSLL